MQPMTKKKTAAVTQLLMAFSTSSTSPADFDQAHELAKRATHANSAKEHFEYNRRFWAIIFGKTQRPILCEVFVQLEDRATRYIPLNNKA
jgi:DNA-binding GntR family transcriptional regulator